MKQSLEDNAHRGGRCQGHGAIVPMGAVLASEHPYHRPIS